MDHFGAFELRQIGRGFVQGDRRDLVGGTDEPTITVEIADATGHSVVEMTKSELTEKATSSEGTWVFVDDRLVSAAEIDNLDFSQASKVRLMPGLVGGF